MASEHGNCLGKKCPRFRDCFYFAARQRMKTANILIVNHALFMSDLALRGSGASLLPEYDVAIFDEAHTLEAVAGDHLGLRVTSGQVEFALNRLYHDRTRKGLLAYHELDEAMIQAQRARLAADDFFDDGRRVAGPQGVVQRPAPVALRPARHAGRGAPEAGLGHRPGGRGDRGGGAADRAARRQRALRGAGRLALELAGAGRARLGLLGRPGGGPEAADHPGLRPARRRADPPPRPLRPRPDRAS